MFSMKRLHCSFNFVLRHQNSGPGRTAWSRKTWKLVLLATLSPEMNQP